MRPSEAYRAHLEKSALFDPRDVMQAVRMVRSHPIGAALFDAVPAQLKRDAFSANKQMFNKVWPRAAEGDVAALKAHMEPMIDKPVVYHGTNDRAAAPFHHPLNAAVVTPEMSGWSMADDLKEHHVFADQKRAPFYLAHELGHASAPRMLRNADAMVRPLATAMASGAQANHSLGLAVGSTLAHVPVLASEAHASLTALKAIHDVHGPAKMMEAIPHAAGAYATYLHSALAPHFKPNFLP